MNTGDFSDFVNGVSAKVNEIIDETQDLSPSFLSTGLFDVVNTPDDLIYRTEGVTGLSYLEAKDEDGRLKTDRTYEAYKTEYVLQERGKVVDISQMLMKTRPSDLEKKLNEVRQLMIASQRTMKKHAWQVLANGFSTTDISSNFPIMRLNDGVSMFSTSHPSRVSGVGNRSNRLAANGVFNQTNAFLMMNMIREQLNGRGLEIGYDSNFLFVLPPSLTKLATEIFNSQLASDTGNNDINYYKGIVDFVSINYLGNASNGQDNADTSFYCFAKDPADGEKSMKYISLIAPKIETQVDFYTKSINISVDSACAFGYSNFEYCAASDGSNT